MGRNINKALKNGNTRELIFYCMLPFGTYTIITMMNTALNIYLTDVLGLTLKSVSFILMVSKIWDAFNDPVMGFIVDKTKTKHGKARPYILWMVLPLALVTALMFFPVNFGGNGNFIYVFVMYMIFYAANTALDIPAQGLAPLVFPENKPRVKAIATSNVVGSLGTILPSTLFFTFAGVLGKGDDKQGYFLTAIIFALMAGIPIFASFFGIKEKVYIPPKQTNLMQTLKIIFTEKKMIVLVIAFVFQAAINVGAIFLPYFAKWNCIDVIPAKELGDWLTNLLNASDPIVITNEALLIPVLQIGSGISYMLSMALVPRLLKRMDKKKLMIYISLIGAVASVFTYIIGIYIVPYNTVPGLILYIVLRFFTNFPVGSTMVLFIAMFSDITDDLEMKHGERLEGLVFSLRSLLNKIPFAIFNAVILLVISSFGYIPEKMLEASRDMTEKLVYSTTQPNIIDGTNYTTLLNAIFFMLTALSAIGLVLQAIPMYFYDFDEEVQEEKLRVFREEKERRLNEELEEAARKQGALV